jgi:hypothetical protein
MPAADPAAGTRALLLLARALAGRVSLSLLDSPCGGSAGSHVAQLGSTAARGSTSSAGSGHSMNAAGPSSSQLLAFFRFMRSKGVPHFPDATTDPERRPVFQLSAHGFTRQGAHSPRITHTTQEGGHLLPGALGGIPVG